MALKNTRKNLTRIVGDAADIQTGHLPNKNLD
jgi:hypothetical protein